jgi:hypothetical protein
MRRSLSYALLAFTFLFVSCGGNTPPQSDPTRNLSAPGKAAYQATKVVKALDVLRDIAVDAERQTPKLLSTDNTRKVVRYHESAVKAIGAVPGGWKPLVQSGLDELSKQIPPGEWAQLEPFAKLVFAVLQEVQ